MIRLRGGIFGAFLACAWQVAPAAAQSPWPADPFSRQRGSLDSSSVVPCTRTIPRLTADSLGPLRVGMTLAEFQRRCPQAGYYWDFGDEGIESPAALVRMGASEVEVTFSDTVRSTIVYLSMSDPRFRTADGIGPGVLVATLRARWGRLDFGEAECGLSAIALSHPGLGFRIDLPEGWGCEEVGEAAVGERQVPPETMIGEVYIYRRPG